MGIPTDTTAPADMTARQEQLTAAAQQYLGNISSKSKGKEKRASVFGKKSAPEQQIPHQALPEQPLADTKFNTQPVMVTCPGCQYTGLSGIADKNSNIAGALAVTYVKMSPSLPNASDPC